MFNRKRVARAIDAYFEKHPKVLVVLVWAAGGFMLGWTMCLVIFGGARAGGASFGVSLLWGVGGAVIFGSVAFLKVRKSTNRLWSGREPDTIEYRIDAAAASVAQARQTFVDVEEELTARKKVLEQIAADASRYQALAGLSKDQADAIDNLIDSKFRRQGRVAWWQLLASVLAAFVLGTFAPDIVLWVRSWWGG